MTEILLDLEPWWRFGAALLIGALIGLEREFVQQRSGDPEFAGIRTFSLIALLGALAAYLAEQHGIILFAAPYLGLVLLVGASHFGAVSRGEEEGITTEVVGLLVPLLGAMVVWGFPELAGALGVVTALVLALKRPLHAMARTMAATDLRATLEFALIAAVVLPLLPNRAFGPFQVLNPFEIWLLVVFVSGISFVGYVLMKVLGAERGIGIGGLLGGLVSSTAVTLSFTARSRQASAFSSFYGVGILLASCVMFPRVLVEVLVVNASLLPAIVLPVALMLTTGIGAVVWMWRRAGAGRENAERGVEVANPLRLTVPVGFALMFAAVLLAVKAANVFFGSAGVYLTAFLTGLTDVDAITLSSASLAASGEIESGVAAAAIVLALLVNTAVKGTIAAAMGSAQLRRAAVAAFAPMLAVGMVAGAAMLLR